MNPVIMAALQVLGYLLAHKDEIKQVIQNIQDLIPDAPGADKAAAVRTFIGKALNIEAQVEAAWPMIAPIFNLFVAAVKTKPAPAAAPQVNN